MNVQEELKALKERIAELEEQDEREFPQNGVKYYYIHPYGDVGWFDWDEANFDLQVQEIDNIFQTEEQAEFAVEKLKVEAELRKYSRPFEPGETSYYIFFNIEFDCLDTRFTRYCPPQGSIYFESEEKAQQAIKSAGAERIKKYIFGVED